jgi:hypothetical protein
MALDGNNLDWWMKKYGTKLGWETACAQTDIDKAMKTGQYIGLAVSSQEYVEQQRKASRDPFYGHVAVFVPGGAEGEYGVTQATNNYTFRGLKKPQDPLFTPEYHTYLFKVPATSWILARTK